ncbi:MAG: hypothetical protein K6U89_15955 [Chloroflexi bacterium]|nr:hypothetical protein [Chloroflexota bacterium]GIW09060.1 MAG: hypothetical protein KatS3mg061_0117 [Dehalococcoidia bacterium]
MPASRPSYTPVDLSQVRTRPLGERTNKVDRSQFARPGQAGRSVADLLAGLPQQLGARDLLQVVAAVVTAYRRGKPVIWGMGGHVIKTGISPLIIDLMQRGVVRALALNGGASIHDVEIALIGATSEDVQAGLRDGSFGMWEETGRFYNRAVNERRGGLGRRLGEALLADQAPNCDLSVLATAAALGIPATVHLTLGADIVHMHPEADGARLGEATFEDFRLLAAVVADLGNGGVYLNVGSAVALPEVFLKALTVARNLGHRVEQFTTANFDMLSHYRPLQNVVRRPTEGVGQGFSLLGQHEVLLPLFYQAIIEQVGA